MVTLQFFLSTWFYLAWLLRFTKMAACLQTRSFVCLLLPAFFCFLFIPCKSQSFHYKFRSCHHNFNRQSTDNLPTDYQQTPDRSLPLWKNLSADSWPTVGGGELFFTFTKILAIVVHENMKLGHNTLNNERLIVVNTNFLPKY